MVPHEPLGLCTGLSNIDLDDSYQTDLVNKWDLGSCISNAVFTEDYLHFAPHANFEEHISGFSSYNSSGLLADQIVRGSVSPTNVNVRLLPALPCFLHINPHPPQLNSLRLTASWEDFVRGRTEKCIQALDADGKEGTTPHLASLTMQALVLGDSHAIGLGRWWSPGTYS